MDSHVIIDNKVVEDVSAVRAAVSASVSALSGSEEMQHIHGHVQWFSLNGFAGTSLLFTELFARGMADRTTALSHLRAAAVVPPGAPIGLHNGVAGLGFAAQFAKEAGLPTARLVASCTDYVLRALPTVLERVVYAPSILNMTDVDVISGVSGIGAFLLAVARSSSAAAGAVRQIVEALTDATISFDPEAQPIAFKTPAGFGFGEDGRLDSEALIRVDAGLAHGLSGIMSLLSLSIAHGFGAARQIDAVANIAQHISRFRVTEGWAGASTRSEFREGKQGDLQPASWCYGAAGIIGALNLASRAIPSASYGREAKLAMKSMRPITTSACACHGVSSHLLAVRTVPGGEVPAELIKADALLGSLLDASAPFSFRFRTRDPDILLDEPGLLNGFSGVALARLGWRDDGSTPWARALLLA